MQLWNKVHCWGIDGKSLHHKDCSAGLCFNKSSYDVTSAFGWVNAVINVVKFHNIYKTMVSKKRENCAPVSKSNVFFSERLVHYWGKTINIKLHSAVLVLVWSHNKSWEKVQVVFSWSYPSQTYFNGIFPKVNRKCIFSMVIKRHFPPYLRAPVLPLSPTRAHRCEADYTQFTPPSASPSFHCKERNHSVSAFSTNIPLPYYPLPEADRGTQTTTLSSQTLIVCACVCIFFSLWHEEGNRVSICSLSACE